MTAFRHCCVGESRIDPWAVRNCPLLHFWPAQSLTQSGRKCSNWPETIAAVAVVHRLIVVTCDVKDFTPAAILGPFP
jgi:hypothetical protein